MQDSDNLKPGRKRPGPPPFAPTSRQRRDVTLYAAGGMSEPGIASEIGICQNTLRKHFAAELEAGHQHELAANLRRLRKAADKGNVTAMKHLDAKFGLVAAKRAVDLRGEQPTRKPAKLGKKEEQQAAAQAVASGTSKFAPPSAPKLVVDNR